MPRLLLCLSSHGCCHLRSPTRRGSPRVCGGIQAVSWTHSGRRPQPQGSKRAPPLSWPAAHSHPQGFQRRPDPGLPLTSASGSCSPSSFHQLHAGSPGLRCWALAQLRLCTHSFGYAYFNEKDPVYVVPLTLSGLISRIVLKSVI